MPNIPVTNKHYYYYYSSSHITAWLCPMAPQVSGVKLSLYLIKLHAMKTYGKVEVQLHKFLTMLFKNKISCSSILDPVVLWILTRIIRDYSTFNVHYHFNFRPSGCCVSAGIVICRNSPNYSSHNVSLEGGIHSLCSTLYILPCCHDSDPVFNVTWEANLSF
jgi:hypothetical protein